MRSSFSFLDDLSDHDKSVWRNSDHPRINLGGITGSVPLFVMVVMALEAPAEKEGEAEVSKFQKSGRRKTGKLLRRPNTRNC